MNMDDLLNAEDPADLSDALTDLLDSLQETANRSGLETLARPAQVAYFALAADSAMNNEGALELLTGSLFGHSEQVVAALREVGAEKLADILNAALQDPESPTFQDAWSHYPDEIEVLLLEWVTAHADTFRAV